MKIMFRTHAFICHRLRKHYWIDIDFVPQTIIEGVTVKDAFLSYLAFAKERGAEVTENGTRTKEPLYVDDYEGNPKQVGFVINGWTYIEGKNVGLELWVRMDEIKDINFEEETI